MKDLDCRHLDSRTMKSCCCNRCSMQFTIATDAPDWSIRGAWFLKWVLIANQMITLILIPEIVAFRLCLSFKKAFLDHFHILILFFPNISSCVGWSLPTQKSITSLSCGGVEQVKIFFFSSMKSRRSQGAVELSQTRFWCLVWSYSYNYNSLNIG